MNSDKTITTNVGSHAETHLAVIPEPESQSEQQNQKLRHSQDLEQQLKYYSDLYELAPIGYLILSPDGVIENINLTGATLLGSEREKLLNQSFTAHVHDSDQNRWQLFLWNLLRFNSHKTVELMLIHVNHNLLHTQLDGICFSDKNQQPKIRLTVTDMSDRKQTEIAQKEARILGDKTNRLKSEFLANMSHEIRTPMNTIVGMAYLMQDSSLNEDQRSYLNKINLASHSLLGIINNILDFSKLEAGQMELKQETFLLDHLFSRLSDMIYVQAKEKNIELIFSISPNIPNQLVADSLRLSQVLFNLLNNAVKFSNRGKIVVSVAPLEQSLNSILLQFSVQDSGCGMTPEQTKRLFQPFSPANTSLRQKHGGAGLSLAISQELMVMMGSKIRVKSQIDAGSTFYFNVRLGIAEQHSSSWVVRKAANSSVNLTGKKILLVEDDEFNRDLAAELLRRLGIAVETAENGVQAVWRIRNQTFDLVLMDVYMPEMDGLTATRLIRANKSFSDLPVIALTANTQNSDREACLSAGMNDYLHKPISPIKLVNMLRYWLKAEH